MKFERIKEFIGNNTNVIIKSCATVALVAFAAAYDIPVNIDTRRKHADSDEKPFMTIIGGSSKEKAILALLNTTKSMAWDSDRIKVAEQIRDIAEESVHEDTSKTAIAALEEISRRMTWDSSRSKISKMIFEIATEN